MRQLPPKHIRAIRALMQLKGLSVRDVSRLSQVPYQSTSNVLTGARNHSEELAKIEGAVRKAPMPARESLAEAIREMEVAA